MISNEISNAYSYRLYVAPCAKPMKNVRENREALFNNNNTGKLDTIGKIMKTTNMRLAKPPFYNRIARAHMRLHAPHFAADCILRNNILVFADKNDLTYLFIYSKSTNEKYFQLTFVQDE